MSMMKARWHQQHDACQGCGRSDRPHIARGYCEACYRKTRAEERRRTEERGATTSRPAPRREWHHDHHACQGCGGTTRPHLSDGLCVDCYRARYVPGELGREEVPRYQPPSPEAVARATASAPHPVVDLASRRATTPQQAAAPATADPPGRALPAGTDTTDRREEADQATAQARAAAARPEPEDLRPPIATQAVQRRAPRLFPRHIRLVRTYAVTCPNCDQVLRNERTGGEIFQESELPPGSELACGHCGAWWEINLD